MAVAKIAVSLPLHLVEQVEEARRKSGKSRSELIAIAVDEYLRRQLAEAEAAAYRRGYKLFPETEEEEGVFAQMGLAFLATVPWDETS